MAIVGKIGQLQNAASDLWTIINTLTNARIRFDGTGTVRVADLAGLGQYVLAVVIGGSIDTRAQFDAFKSLVITFRATYPTLTVKPLSYQESE